jgi:DNA-binding GntR family transcriptional regulator
VQASSEPRAAAPLGGDQVLEAVGLLYEAVVGGRLTPGAVTTQVHLAQLLGVGRTPLREALRIAHSDGLVDFGGRRVTIAELSAPDAEELYVMRITLESFAVRITLPLLRSADFANLEALMAQMNHFGAEGELDALEESNKRFHAILVGASQPRAGRLMRQLERHTERYRRAFYAMSPGGFLVAYEDHRAIVDAAKRGDIEATVRLLVTHYERTAMSVMDKLDPSFIAPRLQLAIDIATGSHHQNSNHAGGADIYSPRPAEPQSRRSAVDDHVQQASQAPDLAAGPR